jgi:hypothetical protein
MNRHILWGGTLALVAIAARALRPAPLLAATITAITPGQPPTASVALRYGVGALPARVIVDVADRSGNGGSATIDGQQMLLEIPIVGAIREGCRVTTTTTYRILGRLYTVVHEFSAT